MKISRTAGNKKAFVPGKGTKALTSAVPPNLTYNTPTHTAYHHMHPADNGQAPRKLLLSFDFGLPSQVHSQ
jgi:hypothetical protein